MLKNRLFTKQEESRLELYGIGHIDSDRVADKTPEWPAHDRIGYYVKYAPMHFRIDGRRYVLYAFVDKQRSRLLLVQSGLVEVYVRGDHAWTAARVDFTTDYFTKWWYRVSTGRSMKKSLVRVIAESEWMPKSKASDAMHEVFERVPDLVRASRVLEVL